MGDTSNPSQHILLLAHRRLVHPSRLRCPTSVAASLIGMGASDVIHHGCVYMSGRLRMSGRLSGVCSQPCGKVNVRKRPAQLNFEAAERRRFDAVALAATTHTAVAVNKSRSDVSNHAITRKLQPETAHVHGAALKVTPTLSLVTR